MTHVISDLAGDRRRLGYAKGRARRSDIIRTASAQFADQGFDGVTIVDIAAACGISRAGLLHHFDNKSALLEAVLVQRDYEDRERFAPYVVSPSGGIGILRGLVDLAGHNRVVPGLIALFVRLSAEAVSSDHPAHGYFAARYRRIRAGTEQALHAAARLGYLVDEVRPEASAVQLTALMDGLQAQWLFDPTVDMAEHMRHAVSALLTARGLRAFEAFTVPSPPGDTAQQAGASSLRNSSPV